MSDSWSGSGAGDPNRPGRAGDCEFGNENGYSCVVCGEEGYESSVHDDRVTARERWRASAADDGSGVVTETAKESDGEVNPGDEVEGISEVGCEIWTGPHAGENGICEECVNESGSGNYEERENDADAAASEVGENEEDHLVAVRRSTQGGKTEQSARTPPLAPHPLSLGLSPRSLSKRLPPLPRPRPLPRPPPRASRSFARISSNRARLSRSSNARESPVLAWRISSFFSSTNVRGTPAGESCASRRRFHRAVIKAGVFEVRKPVRLICILRGSGVCMHRVLSLGCRDTKFQTTDRLRVVLQQTHSVFNHHFVLETDQLHHLLDDPGPYDRQVHLPHVNLHRDETLRRAYSRPST